jgi:hypothetical protein
MISPFARLIDYAVAFHFKRDPSGRLVFLPLISKGQGYFVESKSDEEKLRAFVKMYRSANLLLTLLCYLVILAPTSLGYNLYAGAIPMRAKLMTAVGTGLFWVLCYGASGWTLWSLYKKTIGSFTDQLAVAGPGVLGQVSEASSGRRRLALLIVFAATIIIGVALLVAVQQAHR